MWVKVAWLDVFEGSLLEPQAGGRESTMGMAGGFATSQLTTGCMLPPARPTLLNLPKRCHQLETMY